MDLRLHRYYVAVAEERHFGRAAARLHIAQPSVSRAIRTLERDLGATLLERGPAGVTMTSAGAVLLDEARSLLEQADRSRLRVLSASGTSALTIGSLAGAVEHAGPALVSAFRRQCPDVRVSVRESDFADPTCGLRAGLVDLAVTLAPFDTSGLGVRVLRSDPVEVVLRTDDPLAGRRTLTSDDLAGRRWFRLPEGADPEWSAFWAGGRDGPVVRTAHECLQAVIWKWQRRADPGGARHPGGADDGALGRPPARPARHRLGQAPRRTAAAVLRRDRRELGGGTMTTDVSRWLLARWWASLTRP